jgi:hypothetical protein
MTKDTATPPRNASANGAPSHYRTSPKSSAEHELISICASDPEIARKIVLQTNPLQRPHFTDPVNACAYGALATLTHEQKSFELQEVRTLLSTWATDKDSPQNALLAFEAAEAINAGKYSPNGTPPTFERALELANQIKAAAPKPKPKTKKEDEEFVFEFSTDEKLDECLSGIEWLWDGFIPRGFITALVADQEQGKSMIAQALCDIVLRGTRWPDGQANSPRPGAHLLWIDTEGAIALLHDRMKQWNMPRGRFILPPDPLQELTIDDAKSWAWIEAAIQKFNPPLVIIDALSGAHKGQANSEDDMKAVMRRLSGLAQRYQIALVVIHHLSKPAPGMKDFPVTIHRLRGSGAISQYCRSILALGVPDPAQPERRRLDVIKLNLRKKPPAVGYDLTDSGPAWGDAPEPPKERRAVDDATDFLSVALINGPRESKGIEEEAKQAGIGRNALFDAKKALRIQARREGGKAGRWFWYADEGGDST